MERVITTYIELFNSTTDDGNVYKKGLLTKKDEQLPINTILHRLNENYSKINYNEFLKWQDAQVTNKPTGILNEKEKRRNNR